MTENLTTIVSSATQTVEISRNQRTTIIGERINPTGRKKVLAALKEDSFEIVRQDAVDQIAAGAAILDVNAGVLGADEPTLLKKMMNTVMEVTDVPLCIDTADPAALEAALGSRAGIVETGLFLGLASEALVASEEGVTRIGGST